MKTDVTNTARKPRVLVIPSWYPTEANPIAGSFFQEQAHLLCTIYDMSILHGISNEIGYWSAIRTLRRVPRRGCSLISSLEQGTIPTPPPVLGFRYTHCSHKEPFRISASINAYKQMLHNLIAQGRKPDLLHAHCAEFAGIIASSLAREFHIPWVLTEHQVFVLSNYSIERRQLIIEALQTATVLIAVSYHQMRCIMLHGIDRSMQVAGNLINEDIFKYVSPPDKSERFHILTVTYPSPIKDCDTFFKAIALVIARGHTDIQVTIIGNNSFNDLSSANSAYFQKLAAHYGIDHLCRFIAHSPREDMPKHYAECDVFVSTSIAETFGVAVREALAVGRPVVCTASGGVDDDVCSDTGVKVSIRDSNSIADAVIAIKTNRIRFDPIKMRNHVVSRYGKSAFLAQMSSIYNTTMKSVIKPIV